jgi:segregation and condensation protein A
LSEYRVALDIYHGPLDLLLFLIKRDEIDIYDIPIARITQQYLKYVDLLQALDPEAVSEFLVLAATLMEIKSRTLLPKPPVVEGEEDIVDPRLELVRQLLEYKKFKDAAYALEDSAIERSLRFERKPALPEGEADEVAIENLDIWDLFDAFNRLLGQIGKTGAIHQVGVDDTPLALHAEDIVDSIERCGGTQNFEDIFTGRNRAEMIGLFLALLELIRQRRVRAIQDAPFGPILIRLLDPTPLDKVDDTPATGDEAEAAGALAPFTHVATDEDAENVEETDWAEDMEMPEEVNIEGLDRGLDPHPLPPPSRGEAPG